MPDPSLDDLAVWAAGARAGEAAGERSRARWLRRQAEEEARWAGTLLDLAERQAAVSVRTAGGRALVGMLTLVGRDVCAVRTAGGTTTFVPLDRIDAVTTVAGDGRAATGSRTPAADVTWADVLGRLAEEGARVTVHVGASTEALVGELVGVGLDVVTVVTDRRAGSTAYARLESISAISWRESG